MSELSKVDIYRQIDVLRQSLLDLTMRNQLLNFRPRSMTVEVKVVLRCRALGQGGHVAVTTDDLRRRVIRGVERQVFLIFVADDTAVITYEAGLVQRLARAVGHMAESTGNTGRVPA